MATVYQPKLIDKNMKIRKAVAAIRKKTKLDKSLIAERIMSYGVENMEHVFPEWFGSIK